MDNARRTRTKPGFYQDITVHDHLLLLLDGGFGSAAVGIAEQDAD